MVPSKEASDEYCAVPEIQAGQEATRGPGNQEAIWSGAGVPGTQRKGRQRTQSTSV